MFVLLIRINLTSGSFRQPIFNRSVVSVAEPVEEVTSVTTGVVPFQPNTRVESTGVDASAPLMIDAIPAIPRIEDKQSSQKKVVLVVDDESILREIAKRSLENKYEVLLAADGEEAKLILQSRSDISLVITDTQMPKLDGIGLTKHINSTYPDMPVIISSGRLQQFIEDGSFTDLKVNAMLKKPYRVAELREVVAEILGDKE